MDKLADLRDGGMGIDELHDWAEKNKLRMNHWFFSTDLTFYIKGGRISKASGFIGTVLAICPLLNMDDQGRLIPRFKIRTKRKVIQAIVEKMEEYADGGLEYSDKCYISQSACYEDARAVADLIAVSYTHLDVYKRQGSDRLVSPGDIPGKQMRQEPGEGTSSHISKGNDNRR